MFGVVFGVLLKGLHGIIVGFLNILNTMLKFAIEKPFQFLTMVFAVALVWVGWYGVRTKHDLQASQQVVKEKTTFIEGQQKVMTQYVTAFKVEQASHVRDIQKGNDALASIKKTADKALADAQAKAREVAAKKAQYDNMALKYANANTSAGTAEERIAREQSTTDAFIQDIKGVKK